MTGTKSFFTIFCLLASSNAANLRGKEERGLQLTSGVLNAVIQEFGPELEGVVQTMLAQNFDPFVLNDESTVELGSLDIPLRLGPFDLPFARDSCETTASATYGLGAITGLSSFSINSLEMVPGSEDIQMAMFGLGGAKWSGTWILNATFAGVTAGTRAGLKVESCFGSPQEQNIKGTTTLNDPTLELELTMGGETSNLLRFVQTSQITTLLVEGLAFELGSVDAGFGMTGSIIPGVDLTNTFDAFLLNEFSDQLEPLMVDAMNNALDDTLPLSMPQ